MKSFRLFRRNTGIYFLEDTITRRQESLRTRDKKEAQRLFSARNEAAARPQLNLRLARTYHAGADPQMGKRTWRHVFEQIIKTKSGETLERWNRAAKDKAFVPLLEKKLIETIAEDFISVLVNGTVSTNTYLRRAHNFAVDLNWVLAPVLPRKQWPAIRHEEKRPITLEEHERLITPETSAEWKAFLELAWHFGAAQTDLANLHASDINWQDKTVSFRRKKTMHREVKPVIISFGEAAAAVLSSLPKEGPLFPMLINTHEKHRAKDFKERCNRRGVSGVTLHSYRYAWAVRAREAGMPERFAMSALGHNSLAVHRAYAKQALVKIPSLEELEKKIVKLPAKLNVA